jgi:calcium-binding protein CML
MQWSIKLLLLVSILGLISYARADDEAEDDEMDENPPAVDEEDGEGTSSSSDADPEFDMTPLTSEEMRALHKKMDENGNGQVSLSELVEFARKARRKIAELEMSEIVQKFDIDKDGKVSLKEYLAENAVRHPSKQKDEVEQEKTQEFKDNDDNKDGLLDIEELTGIYHHHLNDKVETKLTAVAMKDKDLNKNGALTIEEFYQHVTDGEGGAGDISDDDRTEFKKLDVDGSGTLTLKELKAYESGHFHSEEGMKKMMEVADQNSDNVLTADELDNAKDNLATHDNVDAHMYLEIWNHHHHEL